MSITCGQCFQSQCHQWSYRETELEQITNGFFSTNVSTLRLGTLKCQCSSEITFEIDSNDATQIYTCSACQVKVIYSHSKITNQRAFKLLKVYPSVKFSRDNCLGCNGEGMVTHNVFSKCENCDGLGGHICRQCLKGSCQFQQEHMCYVCQGRCTIVKGTTQSPCRQCVVLPPKCQLDTNTLNISVPTSPNLVAIPFKSPDLVSNVDFTILDDDHN